MNVDNSVIHKIQKLEITHMSINWKEGIKIYPIDTMKMDEELIHVNNED